MSKEIAVHPRRHTRFDARHSRIIGSLCDRQDSMLKDISMGGACFILRDPIEVKSTCRIKVDDGSSDFHVEGRVAWVRKPGELREVPESREGMYTIGVVFVNTYNTESGEGLRSMIERLVEMDVA